MSHRLWKTMIHSKGFYVTTFRRASLVLLISVSFNILLLVAIFLVHVTEKEPSYYGTNGETPPIQLTGLKRPNYSAHALMENEVGEAEVEKQIPD